MTAREAGSAVVSVVLMKVCGGNLVNPRCAVATVPGTYQVPALIADLLQLVLHDDCPYGLRGRALPEGELELDLVVDLVVQLDQAAHEVEDGLEEIMTGPESERGVQGGQSAPSGGEREEVAVPVCGWRFGMVMLRT